MQDTSHIQQIFLSALCSDRRVRAATYQYIESTFFQLNWQQLLVKHFIKVHPSATPKLETLLAELEMVENLDESDFAEIKDFLQANYSKEVDDCQHIIFLIRKFARTEYIKWSARAAEAGQHEDAERYNKLVNELGYSYEYSEVLDPTDAQQVFDRYRKNHPKGLIKIRSSWPRMEDVLNNQAWSLGDLLMIAARTGGCKSHAGIQECSTFLPNHSGLHVDMGDMVEDEILSRYITRASRFTLKHVSQHFESYEENWSEFIQDMHFENLRILTKKQHDVSVYDIERQVEKAKLERDIDWVFIDYDHYLTPPRSSKKKSGDSFLYGEGSVNYTYLKQIAREYNVLVIIACQTTRHEDKQTFSISAIEASYAKAFPCNYILGFTRHAKIPWIGWWTLAKARGGIDGVVQEILYDTAHCDLPQITKEQFNYFVANWNVAGEQNYQLPAIDGVRFENNLPYFLDKLDKDELIKQIAEDKERRQSE